MQGLSFVDESLNYSINDDTPQPTPLKNDCSSSPSMFISSPLTAQPDDSLLQASMSSFIKNDDSISVIKNEDSMLTVERELFDSTTKKKVVEDETLMKTLYDDDTKLDMKESIQLTAAFSLKGSLVRAKPLLIFDEEEGGDEYDDALENLSQLGIDTNVQLQPPSKKDGRHERSLSPTGVTDFYPDEDFSSSIPPPPLPPAAPPAASSSSPKISFMSNLIDQALSGCHPCSSVVQTKKKQQQPATTVAEKSRISAPSTSSSIERPDLVQRVYSPAVYSPAQELSLARQNANSTQRSHMRRGFN
mmetsp:Transcript_3070/g.5428  ORF Transcript_3070/g.5428 Transcript_3070/m.5428 type:complete len:303 (-) Transcript_3070:199-1107(-)